MKKVCSVTFVACALAVGLAAQEPPTAPRPAGGASQAPAQPAQPSQSAANKITIAGCVQNAPAASATAPAGGAAAQASAKFVLGSAKIAGAGAVGTAGSAATATRYQLEGDEKTITPHLNHQVEITGTVSPASGAGAAGAAGSAAAPPTLKVDSVKMVSATCS
jgi:hypothetical protein